MKQYTVEARFEVSFDANGSHFLVIYGKHGNGGFCCIPNFGIGCEMSDEPNDVFYNTEKLSGAGLSWIDAEAVAKAIKQAGEQNFAKTRNYGQIMFLKDLPECSLVDDGKTDDGNDYEFATVEPGGDFACEPVVKYKNRAFIFHWNDMLALAEKAGLFDDSESVIKALTEKGVEL